MGISSSRPSSISSDMTTLLNPEKGLKFPAGPRRPSPGPTLPRHVSTAVKDP